MKKGFLVNTVLINKVLIIFVAVSLLACSVKEPAPELKPTKTSMEKIRALSGIWETKPGMSGKKEVVKYEVTSGDTAVKEILFPGTKHEMVSVYFVDGDQLVMTHYCMLGNQPHLRAEESGPDTLIFKFTGGSNIDPQTDEHMHELKLTFLGKDRIKQEWTGYKEGRQDHVKVMELLRKPG